MQWAFRVGDSLTRIDEVPTPKHLRRCESVKDALVSINNKRARETAVIKSQHCRSVIVRKPTDCAAILRDFGLAKFNLVLQLGWDNLSARFCNDVQLSCVVDAG